MITIIVAIGRNNEIGKNNDLLWNLPADLKFFKEQTLGAKVAMGKNTFNSLPKLLPGRKHIVLSLDNQFNKDVSDAIVYSNKDEFIDYCKNEQENIFIIGGASVYAMFIDLADVLILTEVDAEDKEADVYFPQFDKSKYTREVLGKNSDNGINYEHVKYVKK